MKKFTFTKKAIAFLLAIAMVISGLTIPRGDTTVVEASEEITNATNIVGEGDTTANDTEANDFKLVNVGTYSYKPAEEKTGLGGLTYTFNDYNQFDEDYAWGYQVLEWNDAEVRTYHVRNGRTYEGSNLIEPYDYPGVIENVTTIKINK